MPTSTLPVPATAVESFEAIYAEAHGDASRVPWADQRPHPALVNWLNAVAPSLVRSGSRVCVVGCGLGDDARELIHRGYDVTAFDCSETAINWAKQLDPNNGSRYIVANLFDLPSSLRGRFDLVVEVNTLQSLLPDDRAEAMKAIGSLVSRHGHVLVICRCAQQPASIDDGPPWAIMVDELTETAKLAGLSPTNPVSSFTDDETPPVERIRAVFQRINR